MIIRIPRTFFDDHLSRGLPTPVEHRRATKRHVWIDTSDPDFPELINDAAFYCDPYGPGLALPENRWIYQAAKGLLKALERETGVPQNVLIRGAHAARMNDVLAEGGA